MSAPWWMCNGWWSPWCLLDIATRCKVRWICDHHDASITGEDSEFVRSAERRRRELARAES